jgi:hypothetical protein
MIKCFVLAVLLCSCAGKGGSLVGDSDVRCDLQSTLVGVAGANATDCGYVRFGEDSQAADDCAVSAFAEGRPFFVSYDRMGIDSHLVRGLVQDSSGRVWVIDYDGNTGGGGGDSRAAIDRQSCDAPAISMTPDDRTQGEMPIACGSPGPYVRLCP